MNNDKIGVWDSPVGRGVITGISNGRPQVNFVTVDWYIAENGTIYGNPPHFLERLNKWTDGAPKRPGRYWICQCGLNNTMRCNYLAIREINDKWAVDDNGFGHLLSHIIAYQPMPMPMPPKNPNLNVVELEL